MILSTASVAFLTSSVFPLSSVRTTPGGATDTTREDSSKITKGHESKICKTPPMHTDGDEPPRGSEKRHAHARRGTDVPGRSEPRHARQRTQSDGQDSLSTAAWLRLCSTSLTDEDRSRGLVSL